MSKQNSHTSFFGRDSELAHFRKKLTQSSLLTVVGLPGIGKRRFVRHALAEASLAASFHQDVPAGQAIDASQKIVIAPLTPLTLEQTRSIQGLVNEGFHIIAVNPRPLFVVEEALFRLGPLDEQSTKDLFRAELERHDIALDDEAQECSRLWPATGGIALLIQIAALHRVHFSHEEVLAKLEAGVHHFSQALLERSPTFQSAYHRLLASFEEQSQTHFAAFSLWNAPFSGQECLAIFGEDALTSLRELCDASLVHIHDAKTPQHSLLVPLQHLAAQRFAELPRHTRETLQSQFVEHYADDDLLKKCASVSVSTLRSAFDLAYGKAKSAVAKHLAARLHSIGAAKEVPEVLTKALEEESVEASDGRDLLLARAHHVLVYGGAYSPEDDIKRGLALAFEGMNTQHFRTLALYERRHGDFDKAVTYYEQALAETQDAKERTLCFSDLAGHYFEGGRLEESRRVFESALVAAAPETKSILQTNYALLQQAAGEFESAEELLLKSLAAHRAQGHRRFEGIALGDLAGLAFEEGLFLKAARYYQESIEILHSVGDMRHASLMEHAAWALSHLCGNTELRPRLLESQLPEWREASRLYQCLVRDADIEEVCGEADEIQLALRIVNQHRLQSPSLLLTRTALHYRLEQERFSCEKRPLLARLLQALVHDRFEKRKPGLSMDDLIRAGWPDEEVREGGENRVYVALTALRKQGLKKVIIKSTEGYRLDGDVHVRWVSSLD